MEHVADTNPQEEAEVMEHTAENPLPGIEVLLEYLDADAPTRAALSDSIDSFLHEMTTRRRPSNPIPQDQNFIHGSTEEATRELETIVTQHRWDDIPHPAQNIGQGTRELLRQQGRDRAIYHAVSPLELVIDPRTIFAQHPPIDAGFSMDMDEMRSGDKANQGSVLETAGLHVRLYAIL